AIVIESGNHRGSEWSRIFFPTTLPVSFFIPRCIFISYELGRIRQQFQRSLGKPAPPPRAARHRIRRLYPDRPRCPPTQTAPRKKTAPLEGITAGFLPRGPKRDLTKAFLRLLSCLDAQ